MDNSTQFNGSPESFEYPLQVRRTFASTPAKRSTGLLGIGVLALLSVATGCVMHVHHYTSTFNSSLTATPGPGWPDDQKMLFEYHVRDGCAALENKRVVLFFHGLTPEQQKLFHFQGNQQAVQIAGNGSSSVSVTCTTQSSTVAFRSDYAAGTNTLRFGEQAVRFAQSGQLLLAGEQTVDLSKAQKVVHLTDGKAVVE